MNKGNFTAADSFPASDYTLEFLQDMSHLAGSLAMIGGQNYILTGCAVAGSIVSKGIIVVNGEAMPFEGGAKKDKFTIVEAKVSDHYNGRDYPEAYILRKAQFADAGEYNWSEYKPIPTNIQLFEKFESIKSENPGFVKMWSGVMNRLDETKYLLCDGRTLNTADYPDLAWFYGKENESTFKLPDLRKKFIVGYDNAADDYNEIGKTGGEEKHALVEDELPEHKHIVPWGENLNTSWIPEWGYPEGYFNNKRGYKAETDNDNTWGYTSPTGINKPHENRPPFYVLAYVVRVKY